MSKKFITTSAYIKAEPNTRLVYMVDSENPETALSTELRNFLGILGYSEIFPNFDNIRIGNVHPFAIMLAQEVLGTDSNINQFPSITIADSSTDESESVLDDNYEVLQFDPEHIAGFNGYRDNKQIFVSDTGWDKVNEVVADKGYIIGYKRTFRTTHSMDFNIWTENKDVTGFLFDMVGQFIVQKKLDLHANYGIDLGTISGRRSGDINLDFGMLLYGGNVTVRATMSHSSVLFDTSVSTIAEIDTSTLPTFFTGG